MKARPFLLNGEWIDSGTSAEIRSPYDQSLIAHVATAGAEHVEAAISGTAAAMAELAAVSAAERSAILERVSQAISREREVLARTIAREAGKPMKAARAEVERAVFTFHVASLEALRSQERRPLPMKEFAPAKGYSAEMQRFPTGPIAAITPFNFPLNLVAHKLAPAMAAGCSILLKPAPQTPLTALLLADLILQAGWPASGLHVLPLSIGDAAPLVEDDRIKLLSFTGSTKVGWELKSRSRKKKVVLELGGNAAVIVEADGDLDYAAQRCAAGGFGYAGQSCIAVQRIFVHDSIYDDFIERFLPQVKALVCGDPLDEATDVGPLIRESDAVRVEQWIAESVARGAKLLCGGKRSGAMLSPTVLTKTHPEDKVNAEEVFGPLVTVEAYSDLADAIDAVNHSRYGLQAGIFTRDAGKMEEAFARLEVGGVLINEVPTFRLDHLPYGGVKDSGLGREGVGIAMEEMMEWKTLVRREL